MESTRNPRYHERAKKGAAARWGPPRRLRLADLTPDQRRVVLAVVEAQRAANAAREAKDDAA